MPIMCTSPMRADPSTIPIPGASTLAFDAVASPVTADADVHYTILPGSVGICFANGTKRDQRRQRVSSAGTTVAHDARFIACAGVPPATFEVRAEVSESGVVQCARTATIGVRVVGGVLSFEIAEAGPPAAARRVRETPRKTPRKTPTKKRVRKRARKTGRAARKKSTRSTRRATRRAMRGATRRATRRAPRRKRSRK